jgi:hypothetical protein
VNYIAYPKAPFGNTGISPGKISQIWETAQDRVVAEKREVEVVKEIVDAELADLRPGKHAAQQKLDALRKSVRQVQ